jgi:predicted RecA/RadA family phage recombinase
MKNYIQEGHSLEVTPSAAVVSGQAALYGKRLGVHSSDAAASEETVAMFKGVFSVTKKPEAMTLGAELYWDDTNKYLTLTSAGNTFVGYCAKAAVGGDAEVLISLK